MEGHIPSGIPPFDGNNYAYWRNIIQTYLTSLGADIWISIVNGQKVMKNTPTDPDEKKLMSCNSKARHVILSGLTTIFSNKVMDCSTAKVVWDKLKIIYEGNPKFRQVTLQGRYSNLFTQSR